MYRSDNSLLYAYQSMTDRLIVHVFLHILFDVPPCLFVPVCLPTLSMHDERRWMLARDHSLSAACKYASCHYSNILSPVHLPSPSVADVCTSHSHCLSISLYMTVSVY